MARIFERLTEAFDFFAPIAGDCLPVGRLSQYGPLGNQGKTKSLATGIEAALGPFLFLADGDLIGLTAAHVTGLIEPVVGGHADLAISLR